MSPELERLKLLVESWKRIGKLLSPIVALLPLSGLYFRSIVPPEYADLTVFLAALVAISAVLISMFTIEEYVKRELQRTSKRMFPIALVFLAVYVTVLVFCIRPNYSATTEEDARVNVGFGLTDEASTQVREGKVENTTHALLDYFGHKSAERIWYGRTVVNLLLISSFVLFWTFLALSLLFVSLTWANDLLKRSAEVSRRQSSPENG